jgi:23S rRNA (cytidine1920-2'-O)/16S rRNA (cytidine1409-2'-O)-methyltransferase
MHQRLDQLVVSLGLVDSRTKAQRRISAGDVQVDGVVVLKPATLVAADSHVELVGDVEFVSRGATKLKAALDQFELSVTGLRVLDVGASTGGFTEMCLSRGASHVVALDVGHDQLHHGVRSDPRVKVFEGINARHLTPEWWQENDGGVIDLVVIDVSFISLTQVIPAVVRTVGLTPWVCLVKPQFEVGRTKVVGGIAPHPADHENAVTAVVEVCRSEGLELGGILVSPITGELGNREYLCWFEPTPSSNQTQWTRTIHELTHS